MAIIVENKANKERYFLLGAGLGMYKATRPSYFGGNIFPHEEEGTVKTVAVCDVDGDIFFIDSNEIRVVEIDDVNIETFRDKPHFKSKKRKLENPLAEKCPGCDTVLKSEEEFCHSCGLRVR
ncbi:hypothetical protein PV797_19955 [Clostridiaceae bacterium M8S5]|nr:hypothetical protein PV797_19955 [Clostridiaceae bacterium M8S5]